VLPADAAGRPTGQVAAVVDGRVVATYRPAGGAVAWLGPADPEKLAASKKSGVPLPSAHSALFAPVYDPAIRTGVTAMTAMAMDLLQK